MDDPFGLCPTGDARAGRPVSRGAQWIAAFVLASLVLLSASCGDISEPGHVEGPSSAAQAGDAPVGAATPAWVAPSTTVSLSTTVAPSTTVSSSAGGSPGLGPASLEALDPVVLEGFRAAAAALAPVPVFAPSALPSGAALADDWWPLRDLPDPSLYDGPSTANPRLLLGTTEPSADILVRVDGGWLLFLENFRGDLGDVPGEPVGSVAGRPVARYAVNNGTLVQWSWDGRWYAVFGRGIPAADVVFIALEMRPL